MIIMPDQDRIDIVTFTEEQKEIINKISYPNTIIKREYAAVCIYLFFNRLEKPENELVSIISQTSKLLSNKTTIKEAFEWMKEKQLAHAIQEPGIDMYYLRIADDFESKIEQLTVSGIGEELKKVHDNSKPKVNVSPKETVGAGKNNYTEMLNRIEFAESEICYAILSTDPYLATINALKKAAKNNVEIKILVANDDLSRRFKNDKPGVAVAWKNEFQGVEKVTIKEYDDQEVLELCSSILIDKKILRLDIYDPTRTRSLDGYLIEICNQQHEHINLIKWYKEKFENAWAKAYAGKLDRFIRKEVIVPSFALIADLVAIIIFIFMPKSVEATQETPVQELIKEILKLIITSSSTYIVTKFWAKFWCFIKVVMKFLRSK